jgi:hypothetical protein
MFSREVISFRPDSVTLETLQEIPTRAVVE